MDRLPEEILLRIFKSLVHDIHQLVRVGLVNKHFYRIIQDPKLWYLSFQSRYPIWGSRVQYAANSRRLIDWKDFVIHLVKQQKATEHFSFEFVQEKASTVDISRKRKMENEQDIDEIIDKYLFHRQRTDSVMDTTMSTPFWIQDPLVVDIDRITKTGVVATGKHRKNAVANRSEHKILFWEYPSWKLIRTFELNLTPPTLTCQIIGIQSIRMPTVDNKSTQKVRFFSLAVGMALIHEMEPDTEDRVDIWKSLFIYRLFNDGSTQCVAHIKMADLFLGREIFLFSDTSWSQSSDGDNNWKPATVNHKLKDWMDIVSPMDAVYDNRFTVFMLAIGPIYDRITGCVQLAKFDMRGQHNILDPSITPVIWDNSTQQLVPLPKIYYTTTSSTVKATPNNFIFGNPTEIITSIRLGSDVSCMIHFKYPSYLNHLICTGSYQDDELSVYDWRFGIKVGTLPWKTVVSPSIDMMMIDQPQPQQPQPHRQQEEQQPQEEEAGEEDEEEEDDDTVEAFIDVRPWGLESTLVLPPYWPSNSTTAQQDSDSADDLSQRGFRLIAVGDNRSDNTRDKLEIKVWDISYLLQVQWDPLIDKGQRDENVMDLSHRFSWWPRRTNELAKLAIHMIYQQQQLENQEHRRELLTTTSLLFNNNNNNNNINITATNTLTTTLTTNITTNHNNRNHPHHHHTNNIPMNLPYSPPKGFQSMLLSHTFDKDEQENGESNNIPVKYTAYNVLYTSLFLLTEDGKITVMDIETGKITGTVENVAAGADSPQVRGIDVNVIGGREVVVTSKEGLLRGIVN